MGYGGVWLIRAMGYKGVDCIALHRSPTHPLHPVFCYRYYFLFFSFVLVSSVISLSSQQGNPNFGFLVVCYLSVWASTAETDTWIGFTVTIVTHWDSLAFSRQSMHNSPVSPLNTRQFLCSMRWELLGQGVQTRKLFPLSPRLLLRSLRLGRDLPLNSFNNTLTISLSGKHPGLPEIQQE